MRTSSNRKKSGKKPTKLTAFWESESPFHMAPRILPISPKVASGFLALTSGLFSLQKTMKGEAWRFSPSYFSFLGLAAFVLFSALGAILSKGCGKEIETACGRLGELRIHGWPEPFEAKSTTTRRLLKVCPENTPQKKTKLTRKIEWNSSTTLTCSWIHGSRILTWNVKN